MRSMRDGASGGFFKYLLFGLLGMSVGGLVVMDVRGVLGNGSVGGSDVARIADDKISIQSFDRSLRRSLAQYRGVTPQKAFEIGITEEILTGEIRTYFLLNEARNIGLELGKDRLALRVAEVLKPNSRPGQSLQSTLEEMLKYQGMSETEFIDSMKRETYGSIIMEALRAGFKPDTSMVANDLYQFQEQKRDIQLIIFPDSEIDNIEPATDEQLKHLYKAVKETKYKIPEFRTTKIAFFDPSAIEVDVSVSEEDAKNYYEQNIKKFAVGEKFVLSQALVDDPEQAQKIYDITQAGKSLQEAVIEIIGSEGKYFEARSFEKNSMFPDLLKAMERIDIGDITPPVKSIMGHHVIRLDEVVPPSTRPFEEVKNSITQNVTNEKRDEKIYKISEELDEMLNDGIALEEINKTIKIQISSIDPINRKGLGKGDERVLEIFEPGDQKIVLDLIFELQKGESSLLQELPSGKLVTFLVSEIEKEHFTPYEQVKDELAQQFINDQKHAENEIIVEKYKAEIGTGGSVFENIASDNNKKIKTIKNIALSGKLEEPLTDEYRPDIFQTDVGGYAVLEFENQFALMKVSGATIPDITDEANSKIAEIQQTVDREAEDEMFLMYLRKLGKKYNVQVNRRLLEQAYGVREDESY